MTQKTPLYDSHIEAGGKMVDFSGWQLPVHYGSLVEEHHAVRKSAGVFDVSHMTIVDITGKQATEFLEYLLCNSVSAITASGSAIYTCMLNADGGIIDDLIVYYFSREDYRLVLNAATRKKDLKWIAEQAENYDVTINEQAELAMLAVQGPDAGAGLCPLLPSDLAIQMYQLGRFEAIRHGEIFVAATGYTGENGFEIALPGLEARELWGRLMDVGMQPCGLGARDSLRLEAGMNLYGTDMNEDDTPLTSGLGWTVAWQPAERKFVGRTALEAQRAEGIPRKLTGFVLDGKGVLRAGQIIFCDGVEVGVITSGTFSPTLQESIAFGRIMADCQGVFEVQIRRNRLPVRQVARTFVRDGKSTQR